MSDYTAGFYYGLWGTLLTAYGFLLGGLIDLLGARWRLGQAWRWQRRPRG